MRVLSTAPRWTRFLFYRKERTRTTWGLRLGVLALAAGSLWLGRGAWTAAVGRSLVCDSALAPSDAILIENFDPDYLLFERARQLRETGLAGRVLVPVRTEGDTAEFSPVALGTVEVMARISRIGQVEAVPIRELEPISLHAARDIQRFIERQRIRSVIVVTPLFRSRRSELVYSSTLGASGISTRCAPVEGSRGVRTWTRSWHGIQDVVQQWIKLQYYRFYVLPFVAPRT